jgi:hypothetical protein
MVPQGTRLGSNCLVGVLSVSPESALERMKDGTSWLGSPPMELPRRQAGSCFAETSTYSPTKLLVLQRLFIEFFRITLPGTFLVLATYSALGSLFWLQLQVSTPAAWALMPLVSLFCLALFVGLAVGLKWLNYARRKHRTDRNGTDRSNVARLLCYDSLIVNGGPVKSRASQLRRGLLQVMGVIEYPNSDGSYFRCICHL